MKTPILGSSYVARSVNAADNRMVNLYPEATPEGGKEAGFLVRCPGLQRLATVGDGPIRGLWTFGDYGYVVSGQELYKLDTSWTATLLGTVSGSGPVSMSDNGFQLFIACNPNGYIYNARTNVFAQITDPDFPGAVTVSYLDGYFVFNEPNSQRLWITQLLEGTSVEPLDFASAEGSPDQLVSLIVDHREVWLFGNNSVEVWYDSGDVDFPLTRIQGAFNEIGCIAPYSVAKLDNGLFWLGADARGRGIVYRANGYTGQRISTHAVEWQIQQYPNLSDAVAYTYQQDGHAFYVLIFPDADTTWVYDVATGSWHERAGFVQGKFTRHRSNCQMSFNDEIVVGDYENGNIYALSLSVYDDNGQPQKWLRSWRALSSQQNDLKRTAHHTLQLDVAVGQLSDPVVYPEAYVFSSANTTPISATQATATWTKPVGMVSADVIAIGGGGGGASGESLAGNGFPRSGGAGGGGGISIVNYNAGDLPASVLVTIGLGGNGGASTFSNNSSVATPSNLGSAGGDSTFGALVTAYGGKGGGVVGATMTGGDGGVGTTENGGKGGNGSVSNSTGSPQNGTTTTRAGAGGGGGGDTVSTTVPNISGNGGASGMFAGGLGGICVASAISAIGTTGAIGAASTNYRGGGGGGGGGAGSGNTTVAPGPTQGVGATGGKGGLYGGGGGGGGTGQGRVSDNPAATAIGGAGGKGGDGTVIIIAYF